MQKTRLVLADSELTASTKYTIDWTGFEESKLDGQDYITELLYDGLNRVRKSIYPEDVHAERKELIPTYNRSGALQAIEFDKVNYVRHIAYNAKGQRVLLAMGNGMMTRYAYDPLNYRLLRIRSEKYNEEAHEYVPDGGVQQDLGYLYDLVGNIVGIRDKAPATSTTVEGPGDLLKQFAYDPLNRLLSATGRESTQPAILPTWDVGVRNHNHAATNTYTRTYQFDKLGNVLQEQHIADGNPSNSFSKIFNYDSTQEHNKLLSYEVGGLTYAMSYDANGNLLSETTSRHHEWGYDDKLRLFRIEASGTPSQWSHYLYDSGGQRVKKVYNVDANTQHITVYIDGVFEHSYTQNSGTLDTDRNYNTLHVLDGMSRLVSIQVGVDSDDPSGYPPIRYNLEDHLGNSSVELEDDGTLINREEYYPFGDTCFGAFAKKRYRYNGKEKDSESGLYNYGMRYYAPWMCRFVSVDPLAGEYPHYTPYQYAGNKPINFVDLDGLEEGDPNTGTLNVTIFVRPDPNDPQPMSDQQYLNWYTNAINDINATWNAGNLQVNGVTVNTGGVNFASVGPNFDPKNLSKNEVLFTVGNGGSLFQRGSGFSQGKAQVFQANAISFVNSRNQSANFGTGYFFAANQGQDAGHEFGHLFGIGDRYHNATTYTNDGRTAGGTDVLSGRTTVPMILPNPNRDPNYNPLDNLYSGPGSRTVTQNQLGYMFGLNRRKWERDYPSVVLVNNAAGSNPTNYTQVQVKNTWLIHRKVTQAIADDGQGGAPSRTSVIHWARSIALGFRVVDQGHPDIVNRALRTNTWNQRGANRNLIRSISP